MKSNLTYVKKLELFKELDHFKDGHFYAMADTKLKNHLPPWVQFSPNVFWLKDPEGNKTLEVYCEALDFFLNQGITRTSILHAFGGGATTDLCGFVAASLLRGLDWVAIPTTLLAMVDGSIGGKVAVNMPQGKNLVGAFHLPKKVLICGDFLTTLPEDQWNSGKGEIIKCGFLSKKIHQLIIDKAPLEDIAVECAKFKNIVVEKDFLEKGDRILLNLGHTLGHAFEFLLKIPHGNAVIMGMKYLFRILKHDEPHEELDKMIKALDLDLDQFELRNYPRFDLKAFISFINQDKKKANDHLRLVLVNGIGSCYVEEVSIMVFKSKILSYDEFKDKERLFE